MKKLLAAVVPGLFLAAFHVQAREAVTVAALLAGALAGLCLAAAGVAALASRAPSVSRLTRTRVTAGQPAATAPPGPPCSAGCGRPATRMSAGRPACGGCGSRLDEAAGLRAMDEARGRLADAERFEASCGYQVTWPPALLPDGETIGRLDVSEFEEAYRDGRS